MHYDKGDYMDVDDETMIKKGRTRVTTLFSATMPVAVDTVEQRVEFVSGDEEKKWVQLVCELSNVFSIIFADSDCSRFSIRRVQTSHRQPEEDGQHGGQGPTKRRGTHHFLSRFMTLE